MILKDWKISDAEIIEVNEGMWSIKGKNVTRTGSTRLSLVLSYSHRIFDTWLFTFILYYIHTNTYIYTKIHTYTFTYIHTYTHT